MFFVNSVLLLCVSTSLGVNIERGGWLDRLVHYHKNRLFNELKELPPIKIKASIVQAPLGYRDAEGWDVEQVLRLLSLLQRGVARPVLRYLRRSMPRRRFMKFADTFLAFPSLALDHPNDFYYDVASNEFNGEEDQWGPREITDESIIVVSNPTEARLPSAQISVKLLKEILEARAIAARYIPTPKKVIMWKPMSTKSTVADAGTAAPDAGGGTGGGQGTTLPATLTS
ncbi:PREDICTED: uncharacterized protein LOC106106925 [Papilio polytes]|uniref:uncharacterized protein LOC106106925 n=1 Tax=Papilio polytes TaxID=76194 RepID=UPI0006764F92|nr:PREDICTED: uncharacterized protein LOC106106925 [Papilio polytes]